MKSFIAVLLFTTCMVSLCTGFSFFKKKERIPPDLVRKEWTAFMHRAIQFTDPSHRHLAYQFSSNVDPLVRAYAASNVPELSNIFRVCTSHGTVLLPHLRSKKFAKALEKIIKKIKKLLVKEPLPGPKGIDEMNKLVRKVHKIVKKTADI